VSLSYFIKRENQEGFRGRERGGLRERGGSCIYYVWGRPGKRGTTDVSLYEGGDLHKGRYWTKRKTCARSLFEGESGQGKGPEPPILKERDQELSIGTKKRTSHDKVGTRSGSGEKSRRKKRFRNASERRISGGRKEKGSSDKSYVSEPRKEGGGVSYGGASLVWRRKSSGGRRLEKSFLVMFWKGRGGDGKRGGKVWPLSAGKEEAAREGGKEKKRLLWAIEKKKKKIFLPRQMLFLGEKNQRVLSIWKKKRGFAWCS